MVGQTFYPLFGTRIPHHRDFLPREMSVPLHQISKQHRIKHDKQFNKVKKERRKK